MPHHILNAQHVLLNIVLGVCSCRLVEEGVLKPQADIEVPEIPMDLATAVKQKKVRNFLELCGLL